MGVSIRLLDDVKRAPREFVWEAFEGGTNVWGKRRVLYNQYGERVLTLLSSPKTSMIDSQAALVEISNEWLYHGIGVDGCLRLLKRCVPFDVTGLSRLDMCCDFVPSSGLAKVIFGLGYGSNYVSGKRCGSGFWSINTDDWMPKMWRGRRIPHCISWGHKTSDVKWKLYYKSKELLDATKGRGFDKPYIVDMWRECGLDVYNVWRLEVSIRHANKLTYNGDILDYNTWYKNTLDLYKSLYVNRFKIRRNEKHADKSNDRIIPFLPIDTASVVKCRVYDGDGTRSPRLTLLRNLVKSVEEPEVYLDAPTCQEVVDMVQGIVKRDRLERYFEAMTGRSVYDWSGDVLGLCGGGRYPMMRSVIEAGNKLPVNTAFDRGDDSDSQSAMVSQSE